MKTPASESFLNRELEKRLYAAALKEKGQLVPTIASRIRSIPVLLAFAAAATITRAQIQPITGVDPSATSSAAPTSQRGMGSTTVAVQTAANSTTILGSQSYTYMVPLLHLPGRNGFDLNLNLYYNSQIWPLNSNSTNADWDTPSLGFRLDFGMFDTGGVLIDPDGSKHAFQIVPGTDTRFVRHYQTTDSSYVNITGSAPSNCTQQTTCQAPNLTAAFKNGLQMVYENYNVGHAESFRPIQIIDPHGNTITITYINAVSLAINSVTDSTGRVINFSYNANGNLSSFGYGQHVFTFSWNPNYQVRFNFGNGLTTLPPTSVLTGVTRPDGTSVAFKYGDWGIVNEIDELSASGNIRYSTAYNFPSASAGALSSNPTYTTQTVFDGVNHGLQWTYNAVTNDSGLVTSMAVSNPQGVTTTNSFSGNGDAFDGLLVQQKITAPDGSGNSKTWRILSQSWGTDSAGLNPRLTAVDTILENGAASGVQYPSYDANGNVTDVKDFDFGTPTSSNLTLAPGASPTNLGPLMRETVTSFASITGINNRPSQMLVKDGHANTVSRTDYRYDEGSSAVHGDLTSMVRYANAASGSGGITSTFTYDSYGNMLTAQQGCCTSTTVVYSSATNFAVPDSVAVGPQGSQLTTTYTYNTDGSTHTSTDPNGVVTTYNYDAAGRVTSVAESPGATVNRSFDDNSINPASTESNTGNSLSTTRTVDGLGRLLADQQFNGTALVSTTSYINDSLGRPTQISNPYGPNDNQHYTTVQYDALGRVTQATPPAVASGITQNPFVASYAGATVTFSDPANRQRIHYGDALGRLVRVDEPGLINGAFASGSVAVSGSEQSVASTSSANGATAGTATVTINGAGPAGYTFCSMENQTCSFTGTMTVAYGANGSFIFRTGVSGSIACNNATFTDPAVGIVKACYINTTGGPYDRSYPVLTHAATPASLTVTIGGSDSTNVFTTQTCVHFTCTTHNFNSKDTGSISFSVNVGGVVIGPVSTNYDGNSSTSTIASGLYSNFPPNSLVTMSNPGGGSSFTLTTTATGSATNSTTFSSSMSSNCVPSDNQYCAGPGWTMPATANFSNGTDNAYRTAVDTGSVTVSIAINGTNYSKTSTYVGGNTPGSIALDLYNKFNSDSSVSQVLRLTQPGTSGLASNVVGFTTVATGAGTNYPITISSATTDADFQSGSTSYPITDSGSTFTPGQNGILYDAGNVSLTVNGFTDGTAPSKTVTYGQGSNAQGIASQLAALIHGDPSFPLDASVTAGSTTINLVARDQGATANNYTVVVSGQSNLSSSFPTPSFANPSASAQLANGGDPTPSFDPSVVLSTTYSYDALGDLLQVLQGQQNRTYAYDSLGELTSSCIPEQNNQCDTFSYTDFGMVQQKIDPRVVSGTTHITTTYGYDALNRLNDIQYNDGTPEVKFTYGAQGAANYGAGRLVSRTDGSGSQAFQYDPQGRVTQISRTIGGVVYPTGYSYTTSGQLSAITYPSGRKAVYGYDPIDRLTSLSNNSSSLLNVVAYNAAGQPLTINYGNGMQGTFGYDSQQRLNSILYGNTGGNLFYLVYDYGTSNDNGQIRGITDKLNGAQTTSYGYDELGRIKTAQTTDLSSANTWKLVYAYDRFGNRRIQDPIAGTASVPLSETPVDPATNHIIAGGYTYDAAGNLIADGLHTYTFDADNRLTQVDGTANTFVYDADGLRIQKNNTVYIFDNGKAIAEYASGAAASSPNVEYFYAGRKRVAALAGGALTFTISDHLSTRVNTNSTGAVVRTYGHFPFGETWYQTIGTDKWDFTTYERDQSAEGGLDYANARFNDTRIGRFMSLDPLTGNVGNPQSLNRYAYVGNDPINLTDPTGMGWADDSTFLCELDDKGDPTTVCASLQGPGEKAETQALNDFVTDDFDVEQSLKNPDPFADPLASTPAKDPLTAAADKFDAAVNSLFAAVKAAEFIDRNFFTMTDAQFLAVMAALGVAIDDYNHHKDAAGNAEVVAAAKYAGYTPAPPVKSIAQTRAQNVYDTGKPFKFSSIAAPPKTSVKGSSNASAQRQLRVPPSGADCFTADGWQLLLETFWNPLAYLDPTSSSSTTCVK